VQPFSGPAKCLASIFLVGLLASGEPIGAQTASSKTASHSHRATTPGELPLIDLEGYNRVLAKYRGKPLLVTFWATWCEPCRDEFPMVVELAKHYAPQGLAVFGVSLDDDADMHLVQRFLAKNQPGFPNYRQKPGIDVDAFYRGVNPAWTGTMPETVFYGRDGRIVGHFVGAQPREAFEQGIHMILAGNAGFPRPALLEGGRLAILIPDPR
jgi:thiol-disulfide isomerase/thioredoxin